MDINKMLAELREERERIDEAILTLERLARSCGRRRGRPPSWFKEVADSHLNVGHRQQSNGGVHTGQRRGRGRPQGSKNRPPQPVEVGWRSIESMAEGEPDL